MRNKNSLAIEANLIANICLALQLTKTDLSFCYEKKGGGGGERIYKWNVLHAV